MIKEGDNIVVVTFFATKPSKKGVTRQFLITKPSKKVTEVVVFFFFATTEPQQNETRRQLCTVIKIK